jgi:hypothetical protein
MPKMPSTATLEERITALEAKGAGSSMSEEDLLALGAFIASFVGLIQIMPNVAKRTTALESFLKDSIGVAKAARAVYRGKKLSPALADIDLDSLE